MLIPKVGNMVPQVSSSHDNGQSMVIPLKVLTMLCKLSSPHNNGQSMVLHPQL